MTDASFAPSPPGDARAAILSLQPVTESGRKRAVIAVAVSAALFAAAVPFSKAPLAPAPAFIAAYQSALVVCDLIIAVLLFEQLRHVASKGLLVLACGYVLTALVTIAHALSFPGLLAPEGWLGAGPQSTAWLYVAWHAVFPACVIAYAVVRGEFRSRRLWVFSGLGASLAAAAALTALATAGHSMLPTVMSGNAYTPLMTGAVGVVWAMSLMALAALWWKRPHTVLDVWLMVIMCAWTFDVALSAMLNGGRFDFGFYAGRIFGLIAAVLVLAVLLREHGRLYRRVLERTRQAEAAQQAALAAEKAKGALLATVTHEIRTPMTGVMGMLELAAAIPGDKKQGARLAVARESCRSLLRILDDVLDHSRIEAGKLELRPEPVSVKELVERASAMYAGNAASKGLALAADVDDRIGAWLSADPLRLSQILNNLLSNAIKFTSEGSVVIRADLVERLGRKEIVRFSVADTGCGILPEDRASLFEPFVQAGPARAGSSGLGLSICWRLATLMNGLLEVQSHPGVGTKVTLTLPMMIAAEAAASATTARAPDPDPRPALARPPSVEEARAAGRLLLVADDHPVNRMVLVEQLGALGFAADTAANGLEAIDRWRRETYAAILTDCRMPEMDGYELARHVRACEARKGSARIPIIACTANTLEGEATECLVAGMDDYLPKPISLRELARKLEQWIPDAHPIDRATLAAVTRGDPAREREVLTQFLRYSEDDVRNLDLAVRAGQFDRIAAMAHRVKGSSGALGATALAGICTELERQARAGSLPGVAAAMSRFEGEVGRLDAFIGARVSA